MFTSENGAGGAGSVPCYAEVKAFNEVNENSIFCVWFFTLWCIWIITNLSVSNFNYSMIYKINIFDVLDGSNIDIENAYTW